MEARQCTHGCHEQGQIPLQGDKIVMLHKPLANSHAAFSNALKHQAHGLRTEVTSIDQDPT